MMTCPGIVVHIYRFFLQNEIVYGGCSLGHNSLVITVGRVDIQSYDSICYSLELKTHSFIDLRESSSYLPFISAHKHYILPQMVKKRNKIY